mgnify:CR=1 FL=1|jgi:hypothetical protein
MPRTKKTVKIDEDYEPHQINNKTIYHEDVIYII